MRIGILSKNQKLYSTQRLKEAIVKAGHKCKILHQNYFAIYVEEDEPSLMFKQKSIPKLDAIIPRIAASESTFGDRKSVV
jgi:ribosomal protein S6--L-glutamate ligase